MIAAQGGDELALAVGEAGKIDVGGDVIGVFVMTGIVDVMAGFGKIARGFEQPSKRQWQLVQRLDSREQELGEGGNAAGVTNPSSGA